MTDRILLTAANGRPVDITTQIGDLFEWARLGRLSAPDVRPWAHRLGTQLYTSLGPEALKGILQIVETQIGHQAAAELAAVWEGIGVQGGYPRL